MKKIRFKNMKVNEIEKYIDLVGDYFAKLYYYELSYFGDIFGGIEYKIYNITNYMVYDISAFKIPRKLKKAYKKAIISNFKLLDSHIPFEKILEVINYETQVK